MYETLTFALDFPPLESYFLRKLCKCFVLVMSDSDSKEWCFLMITQKCDTNKNVTKMGVIIKEIYYTQI
jgi:hypothetical protein